MNVSFLVSPQQIARATADQQGKVRTAMWPMQRAAPAIHKAMDLATLWMEAKHLQNASTGKMPVVNTNNNYGTLGERPHGIMTWSPCVNVLQIRGRCI